MPPSFLYRMTNPQKIYTLPGLGYTKALYSNLELPACSLIHLDWIEPHPGESLSSYAERLFANLPFGAEKISLIGHSFGGILCQEIAKIQPIDRIVLLSSIVSRKENSPLFRALAPLGLHKRVNKKLILGSFPLWAAQHGFVSAEEKDLFRSMVSSFSDAYFSWALWHLSRWDEGGNEMGRVVRIHGDNDKTFSISRCGKIDYQVEGGSHIMVYKQPQKINELILKALI